MEKIGQWTVLSVDKEEKNIKPEGSQESRNHLSAFLLYTPEVQFFLPFSYRSTHSATRIYLFSRVQAPAKRSCSAERIVRNQSASNLPTVRYDLQPTPLCSIQFFKKKVTRKIIDWKIRVNVFLLMDTWNREVNVLKKTSAFYTFFRSYSNAGLYSFEFHFDVVFLHRYLLMFILTKLCYY